MEEHANISVGELQRAGETNTCLVHRAGMIPQILMLSHGSAQRKRPFTAETSTPRTYHIPNELQCLRACYKSLCSTGGQPPLLLCHQQ